MTDGLEGEIERATRALESGDLVRAERLLADLRRLAPWNRQVRFLLAHVALRHGRRDEAIALLRGLLSEDPSLIRVRLDLARALYEAGYHEAAAHHFELALGADLPPVVRRNVQAYLDRLRYTHTYLTLNAFVSRDSNANQGSSTSTIYLFGLPFELAPEARPKGATGLVVQANGRVAFGPGRRTYVQLGLDQRDYEDASIDYGLARLGVGYSVPLGGGRLGAEAGVYEARYQHRSLSEGPWLRVYGSARIGPRLEISPSLQRQRNNYAAGLPLSGTEDVAAVDASFALTRRASLGAGIAALRYSAADALYSFDGYELRLRGVAELPFGFIVDAVAAHTASNYDAVDTFFGTRRRDRRERIELNVTQRLWSLWQFAPKLVLARIRNDSNQPLFAWERDVVSLGVTTRF